MSNNNHYALTVKRVQAALEAATAPLPLLPGPSITALEAMFPPRCLLAGEDVEAHRHYAGKVELIAMLRARFNEAVKKSADTDSEADNPTDDPEAERAAR